MARLLITGATGFIGGRIAAAALERGLAVRALVRAPRRAALPPGVELFTGDLQRPESLAGIEDGVSAVVHSAGILGKWGAPASEVHDVNVGGTRHLLDRFRDSPLERFVHLGAGGTTGPLRQQVADESYPPAPATPYERSKWDAEREVLERAARTGLPALVLRPTFTYGPGDPHKLPLFRAVQRGRFAFIGDGKSLLHPVFVEDLVQGVFLGLARGKPGEVYIVGGAAPVTTLELVRTIAEALGVPAPRWHLPWVVAWTAASVLEPLGRAAGFEPVLTRSRVMMMHGNFGYSIDKARRELGYQPATSLREGVARTVAAYRAAGLL